MSSNDITLLAAERLEAALERLAEALEARFAAMPEPAPAPPPVGPGTAPGDMVPRAEVERLAARLDEALARLRTLLGDDAGSET
ncbi:hypothetical protein EJV46_03565 [Roseococcus sp. SYP-B2431]|uniref:hypothetical protein n=1 Tax=Roseococcus sp. SYP-B2431 TaxID=2496640 RepID=UPI00103D2ABC|nr:hypothetical protein [Roseococcus sp. SYP-B2431]TCH99761.1 hypothetical protein EJV46_03565 [Roseococcus sp. SYP-B2431]